MAGSTRSLPTPKYEQGETVLCYEPDLTKARVLYEAKVLEVDITKDDKGKKVPEYFIHFSGWNKSWDRWVVEDQVLKNSEANQALKAKLHENATKLPRKRKHRTSTASATSNKETEPASEEPASEGDKCGIPKVEIEIPSQLKLKLEDDCYFIKRKKRLVKLPRSPNIHNILEEYYHHCTQTLSGESCDLVREIMDGLRIYFDFTLPTLLLYNFERDQYCTVMKINPESSGMAEVIGQRNGQTTAEDEKCGVVSSTTENSTGASESGNTKKESERRSLRRRPLRSQPAQPAEQEASNEQQNSTNLSNLSNLSDREESQSSTVSSTSWSPENTTLQNTTKRKAEELEEAAESCSETGTVAAAPLACLTTPLNTHLLPASCNMMPSRIYGPEHFLRLFVKLPSLLARTNMPEKNLTTLLEHVDLFLKYLVERANALFPEDAYQSFL